MVWEVEYEYPDEGEHSTTIFNTEMDAYRYALVQAADRIQDSWDLDPGADDREVAVDFNTYLNAGSYKKALRLYNDHEDSRSYGCYYHVSETVPQDFLQTPNEIDLPVEEDDDDGDVDDEDEDSDTPYLATEVGATCRGPCGNYFPDAYADHRDGTIECYSCRALKSLFGPH